MKIRTATLVAAALMVGTWAMPEALTAAPITGVELGTPVHWAANSTNELNYLTQVPGREGQIAPYVLFVSSTPTSVTLEFNNGAPGLAFFEIRRDGLGTGTTNHPNPLLTGLDTIHTGGVSLASGILGVQRTYDVSDMVEVRLALGGERDWDFNWTAFEVEAVPEPATFTLLGVGLLGLGALRRRRG